MPLIYDTVNVGLGIVALLFIVLMNERLQQKGVGELRLFPSIMLIAGVVVWPAFSFGFLAVCYYKIHTITRDL